MHRHRCGFQPVGWLSPTYKNIGKGCGLVWEHSEDNAGSTAGHTCEACGVETWHRYHGPIAVGRGKLRRKRRVLPPPITEQLRLFPCTI